MHPRPQMLLSSIHDVSPRFESEVDGLVDLLQPHVSNRIAMLVVPNHWGGCAINAGSPFADRLRSWAESGFEMFVHGFYHQDRSRHERPVDRLRARMMTAGEGEFLGLPKSEAAARIRDGTALVEDIIGRPVTGFIAPAWLYSAGALEAMREQKLAIAEDHLHVWSPASGAQLARGPVITWASRTPLRLASSLAAAALLRRAPLQVLRVGVHPPDLQHPRLVRSIEATLRTAVRQRRPARYSDLLAART